jgi:hypothetical protein
MTEVARDRVARWSTTIFSTLGKAKEAADFERHLHNCVLGFHQGGALYGGGGTRFELLFL